VLGHRPGGCGPIEAAGAHNDKCPDVVGKAAGMAVDIILKAGLVSPA
jgi:hypothetical protein